MPSRLAPRKPGQSDEVTVSPAALLPSSSACSVGGSKRNRKRGHMSPSNPSKRKAPRKAAQAPRRVPKPVRRLDQARPLAKVHHKSRAKAVPETTGIDHITWYVASGANFVQTIPSAAAPVARMPRPQPQRNCGTSLVAIWSSISCATSSGTGGVASDSGMRYPIVGQRKISIYAFIRLAKGSILFLTTKITGA